MRIGHIEMFVADPFAARDFYQSVLGFEVVAEQGQNIWLRPGATEVLLRPGPSWTAGDYSTSCTALVLYTHDLDAAARKLTERGLQFAGTDGSPKCLTFHDLDASLAVSRG